MPSIIDSTDVFEVKADVGHCWTFFTSLKNIGGCIPGSESMTSVDERTAVLAVKFSVGHISKTFQLRTRFKDVVPESLVSFVGEGSDAEVIGTVTLGQGSNPGATRVSYKLQIRPVSVMGRTAVTMLGKDMVKRQAEAFVACVRSKLEAAEA